MSALFADPTQYSAAGAVCSVDPRASQAGVELLTAGGSAADAAVAASAVLAVTTPHMCGMGGDLLALVAAPDLRPAALMAVGRAGSGADPDALREDGHDRMPFQGDVRTATVPGCVDGWLALHAAHGRLPLADVLAPAIECARHGFPVSMGLAAALASVSDLPALRELLEGGVPVAGQVRRRPGHAAALAGLVQSGRDSWYGGPFGAGLLALGKGWFTPADLTSDLAVWVEALALDVDLPGRLGPITLHTTPAPSQGYLTLAGLQVATQAGLGAVDPGSEQWAHLLIEAAKLTGQDRPRRLHDTATAAELLDDAALADWAAQVRPHSGQWSPPTGPGGTIFLCAVDADGMVVSLSQSNAAGFGSLVGIDDVGVVLHNRGIGFSLDPGSPNLLAPGKRPSHTLSPLIGTDGIGDPILAAGTMGGDSQPQILLQLLARLDAGQTPGRALEAARWSLAGPDGGGFDTWGDGDRAAQLTIRLEPHVPADWASSLAGRGHLVEATDSGRFGHAHLALRNPDGTWAAASDPRAAGLAAVRR